MADDPLQALVNLREAVEAVLLEQFGITVHMFAPMIEKNGAHGLQILASMDPDRIGKTVEEIDAAKKEAAAMSEMERSFKQQDQNEKVTASREAAERLLGRLKKSDLTQAEDLFGQATTPIEADDDEDDDGAP